MGLSNVTVLFDFNVNIVEVTGELLYSRTKGREEWNIHWMKRVAYSNSE